MIFAWVIEILLIILLAYIYPLNIALGTRDLSLLHFGFYSAIFSILLMAYDEIRKLLIRIWTKTPNKPGWFERYCLT
jgi:hypothetical protein